MADLFSGESAQIAPFNFGAHAVRVIMRDGEPWFVASDVCAALDYVNTSKAVADHLDDDERSTITNSESRNGGGKLTIINESGLYALVLRSRKPQARKFAKWVTGEVLPSIRKTGGYSVKAKPALPAPQYHYPLSSADPHDRPSGLCNSWLTPRRLLDPKNRAPELELIGQLERDGHDVTGAKVRILAMREALERAQKAQANMLDLSQRLERLSAICADAKNEYGMNVLFVGTPDMNCPIERHVFGDQMPGMPGMPAPHRVAHRVPVTEVVEKKHESH